MSSVANAKANANAKAAHQGGKLLFLQEVDDLVAVLALVGSAGDVDPVDAAVAERSNSENLK